MKKTICVVCVFLSVCAAFAETESISFQGTIRDQSGALLSRRSHIVEFRLYHVAQGGVPVWGEAISVILDAEGNFATTLFDGVGSKLVNGTLGNVIKDSFEKDLYLGLTVTGSGEMQPRQKLFQVPFAIAAQNTKRALSDFSVQDTFTATKLNGTGEITVNGKAEIKGNATVLSSIKSRTGMILSKSLVLNASHEGKGVVRANGGFFGNGSIPMGGIIMWAGNSGAIPDGWALCDGKEGRPDLLKKFIRGASTKSELKQTGGAENVTLTIKQIPAHNHSFSYTSVDQINTQIWGVHVNDKNDDNVWRMDKKSFSTETAKSGGGKSHPNMPPYYTLCYLIRVK